MPREWRRTKIGDVAKVFDGPHATPPKTKSGPIFLGISTLNQGRIDLAEAEHLSEEDFLKWTRRVSPSAGDVVFSYETRLGEAAIIPTGLRCCLGRRMGLVRTSTEELDPRFFLYQYLSPSFQAFLRSRTVHGSTVDRIALVEFPNFLIDVPAIDEQQAIAEVLGTLDDKIELNRRMNETLEAIARAIFKSWFVHFDPVRAKASGEPPESICRRLGLTPELLGLFPGRLVDSALGKIPDGWTWSVIGDEVSTLGGATPSTTVPEYWNGRHAWVTPKDLSGLNSKVLTRSERRITAAGVNKIGSGKLPIGAVLLSSRAPIGYVALSMIPVSINQGFIAMVCDKRLPNMYALHWALENVEVIKQRGSGTTFAEISKSNFRPMPVLVPALNQLRAFQELVAPFYDVIAAKVGESTTLGELRDTLLPKLLSGELRIPLESAA
jgi:type I restriction enzyme, S subunit